MVAPETRWPLCQLTEALSTLTVAQDGVAIENKRFSSDVPALEFGAAHSGSYPLDDQVAFKFNDSSDDDDNSPLMHETA